MPFVSGSLISVLFGVDFVSNQTRWIVLILFIAVSIELVFFWTNSLVLSLGRAGYKFMATAIGFVFQFSLAIVLIPSVGPTGMALSVLTATIFVQGAYLALFARHATTQR